MIINNDELISQQTIEEYCNHLVNKVYNLLILKENNKDIIKPINKIIKELKGSTTSELKPFIDNQYILEIVFIISGLKEEIEMGLYKTIIFDCCNKINLLPQRLLK
jgi:adenosine deaminase